MHMPPYRVSLSALICSPITVLTQRRLFQLTSTRGRLSSLCGLCMYPTASLCQLPNIWGYHLHKCVCVRTCVCVCVCEYVCKYVRVSEYVCSVCVCVISNIGKLVATGWMGVRWADDEKGGIMVNNKRSSYTILFGVHSTIYLMHPHWHPINYCMW